MWEVKPGDLVVCVKKEPWTRAHDNSVASVQIAYGTVCTVAEVVIRYDGVVGFVLAGYGALRWVADNFRPVSKPSIESLRGLLNTPELEGAI